MPDPNSLRDQSQAIGFVAHDRETGVYDYWCQACAPEKLKNKYHEVGSIEEAVRADARCEGCDRPLASDQSPVARTCECCERKVIGDFRGWVIDSETGADFCPECAYSLLSEYARHLREALEQIEGHFLPGDHERLCYVDAVTTLKAIRTEVRGALLPYDADEREEMSRGGHGG